MVDCSIYKYAVVYTAEFIYISCWNIFKSCRLLLILKDVKCNGLNHVEMNEKSYIPFKIESPASREQAQQQPRAVRHSASLSHVRGFVVDHQNSLHGEGNIIYTKLLSSLNSTLTS